MSALSATSRLRPLLVDLDACSEALEWAEGRTISEASWLECSRGDWLIWIAVKLCVDRSALVLAACACARLVLRHVPAHDERPRSAIEIAERWTRQEASALEVRRARYRIDFDLEGLGEFGARAAYYAAGTVDLTANAGDAIDIAADCAEALGGMVARRESLAESARLVRTHIPWAAIETALRERGAL